MGFYPNDLPKMNLAQKADRVLQTFRDRAITGAGTGNRVVQICQLVAKLANRETNPGDPGYEELVQALKDVNEWWLITEILGAALFEAPFLERFRRSLADAVLPVRGVAQSQGRDTQFELFIAAIASRAGFQVQDLGPDNADWLFEIPSGRCSVETKRVKSWAKLETRIRDASAQIEKSQVGGMIVLDVGMALNTGGIKLDQAVPDEVIDKASKARDLAFRKDYLRRAPGAKHSRIEGWIDGRPVGVLIMHDYLIRPAASTPNGIVPWTMMGFWPGHILVPNDSLQHVRYRHLHDQFGLGLSNL